MNKATLLAVVFVSVFVAVMAYSSNQSAVDIAINSGKAALVSSTAKTNVTVTEMPSAPVVNQVWDFLVEAGK
jgi:hypothetical protein